MNDLRSLWAAFAIIGLVGGRAAAQLAVTNVSATPRWPWEDKVDIGYEIVCENPTSEIRVVVGGVDYDRGQTVSMSSTAGDGTDGLVTAGVKRVTWDAGADKGSTFQSASFAARVSAVRGEALYMIVDLSAGPTATNYPISFAATLPDPIPDSYKTTNLVLRYCPPGTYFKGSPTSELGRVDYQEERHEVTLTKPFYIGIFEVTQKQWQFVMGTNPSLYVGDARPVDWVHYIHIRGSDAGTNFPPQNSVEADSFMGRLRIRSNLLFDLPTEAQWEYACRAGTTNALNSGKNLTQASAQCPNMDEVGRYLYNRADGKGGYTNHTTVGSYLPNNWGLYDMHGNVWEWCLEKTIDHLGYLPVTDPSGVATGRWYNVGGSYDQTPQWCRSASRGHPDYRGRVGFRVAYFPEGL